MPDYRKTIGRMNALSSNRALGAGPQREDQAGLTELDRLPGLANLAPEGASALRCAPQGTASEAERDAYWQGLLAFFRTGKGGGEEAISPALMTPFQEGSHLGTIFPLWAPDANTWAESPPGPSYRPLTLEELLQNALSAFAPEEGDAPLLKRQLPRFLRILRHLAQGTEPLAAEKLWADGAEELQKELQLKGVEALMLTGELNQLRKALPAGGVLIPFPPYAPLLLLSLLLAYEGAYRSARLSALAEAHIPPLQELLAVEKEKQPQAKDPEPMGSADVLPGKEGSHERFFRLYKALDILQAYQRAAQKPKSYLFSEEGLEEQAGIDTAQWFAHCERHRTSIGNLFESARSSFEASMSAMASFWAALRIARLESDNAYQPAVHDDFFAAFDWRVFSEEEMALSPPTLLLVSDSALLGPALPAFSELLQANLPVKVVSFPELRSAVSLRAHALEPVALALAHRNAFVLQGSAVAPGALLGGMQKGLCRPVPALFYLLGMEGAGHEAYRNAMAAVEGRAFPGLVYDPLGGSQWGQPFHLDPEPGQRARLARARDKDADGHREQSRAGSLYFCGLCRLSEKVCTPFQNRSPRFLDAFPGIRRRLRAASGAGARGKGSVHLGARRGTAVAKSSRRLALDGKKPTATRFLAIPAGKRRGAQFPRTARGRAAHGRDGIGVRTAGTPPPRGTPGPTPVRQRRCSTGGYGKPGRGAAGLGSSPPGTRTKGNRARAAAQYPGTKTRTCARCRNARPTGRGNGEGSPGSRPHCHRRLDRYPAVYLLQRVRGRRTHHFSIQ